MPSSTTISGWGAGSWGQIPWGAPLVTVSVDGSSATASVGSVTIALGRTVATSGLSATSGLGTVSTITSNTFGVTGFSATGTMGTVTPSGKAVTSITGVSATGAVGNVLLWGEIDTSQTADCQLVKVCRLKQIGSGFKPVIGLYTGTRVRSTYYGDDLYIYLETSVAPTGRTYWFVGYCRKQ